MPEPNPVTNPETNPDLTPENNPVTIAAGAADPAPVPDVRTPERSGDAPDATRAIIEQQQSTIDALMARTEQLTKQINSLLASGVQITDEGAKPPAQQDPEPNPTQKDDYVSFKDLGALFGKK